MDRLFFIALFLVLLVCGAGFALAWSRWRAFKAARRDALAEYAGLIDLRPSRVDCSWCGGVIHRGREPVSHGICVPCAVEHFGYNPSEAARR